MYQQCKEYFENLEDYDVKSKPAGIVPAGINPE